MELVGIVLFIPLAFVAGGIYACVIHFVLRYRIVSRVALWASTAVLVGLLLEWVALITVGAVRSRAIIGPAFYPLHLCLLSQKCSPLGSRPEDLEFRHEPFGS